jgi:5'-nucleotidase
MSCISAITFLVDTSNNYFGAHTLTLGDVLRSKKARGWKTFLVIPELNHELAVWTGKRHLFEELQKLDGLMAELYKNLDAKTRDKPEIATILNSIKSATTEMEQEYSVMGSLFRSGSRTTFFASQAARYADIYASNCCNLFNYPIFYFFRAPMTLMPHESTVPHTDSIPKNMEKIMRQDSVGNQGFYFPFCYISYFFGFFF